MMTNELLFIVSMIVTLTSTVAVTKFFGKNGLFAWVAFSVILANIEVIKCVDMFGMSVTLGNVLYGSIFMSTDIIHELYGGKEARKAVKLGFFATIVYLAVMQLSLLFTPNEADFASGAMHELFSFAPRICIASLVAYIISNTLDTYLFGWIKKHVKMLWVRNNGSTLISQLVDSIIFTALAFWGTMANQDVVEMIITTYAIKLIVSVVDTPFIYWAVRGIKRNEE